ncbi:unnamed protein product [Ceratitis capitata]|uniref:(Mediterranean fruit fly) hypothetical protein n=1 Tax=Ceratitis capitata TaxID=7213 RepID=A0A811VH32_CERCA|nr:unnamed protein product [Ceratitis capitata]
MELDRELVTTSAARIKPKTNSAELAIYVPQPPHMCRKQQTIKHNVIQSTIQHLLVMANGAMQFMQRLQQRGSQ